MSNFKEEWDPENTLYGTWGCRVIHPSVSLEVQQLRSFIMTAQAYELLRWQGYGRMMGRSAHPTGVKLYERLGGRGSGEVTFE